MAANDDEIGRPILGRSGDRRGGRASLNELQRGCFQCKALAKPGEQSPGVFCGPLDQHSTRYSRIADEIPRVIIDMDEGNLSAEGTGKLAAEFGRSHRNRRPVNRDENFSDGQWILPNQIIDLASMDRVDLSQLKLPRLISIIASKREQLLGRSAQHHGPAD
jgi:hypothetical protein